MNDDDVNETGTMPNGPVEPPTTPADEMPDPVNPPFATKADDGAGPAGKQDYSYAPVAVVNPARFTLKGAFVRAALVDNTMLVNVPGSDVLVEMDPAVFEALFMPLPEGVVV